MTKSSLKDCDIVIPYKKEGSDLELRYTLRGIAENFPHRKVFICGDFPDWVKDVEHIPRAKVVKGSFEDVNNLVMDACLDPRVSNDFVFFNDDIFVLRPVESLPDYYLGTLKEDATRRRKTHGPFNKWARGTSQTLAWLLKDGIDLPLSFEVHMPMRMNKLRRLAVGDIIEDHLSEEKPLFHRSVYGNLYATDPEFMADIKFVGRGDGFNADSPYLSTLQTRFVDSKVGKHIMSILKHKCKYEK